MGTWVHKHMYINAQTVVTSKRVQAKEMVGGGCGGVL